MPISDLDLLKRAEKGDKLSALEHDQNLQLIEQLFNQLKGVVLAGINENGSLKDGAVSTPAKLSDGVVTTSKVADGAVTLSKLAADVLAAIAASGGSRHPFRVGLTGGQTFVADGEYHIADFNARNTGNFFDPDNAFDVTGHFWTCPETGYYELGWFVQVDNSTASFTTPVLLMTLAWHDSGGAIGIVDNQNVPDPVGARLFLSGSALYRFTAGQVVDMRLALQQFGGPLTGNVTLTTNSYFWGFMAQKG